MTKSTANNIKCNALGGKYHNGKPLSVEVRREIAERYDQGQKVTAIARDLKLTHGVVSKITRQYVRTNSYLPRSVRSAAASVKSKTVIPFSIDAILSDTKPTTSSSKISDMQMTHLMASFEELTCPTEDEVARLATVTGLTFAQIITWFRDQKTLTSRIVPSSAVSITLSQPEACSSTSPITTPSTEASQHSTVSTPMMAYQGIPVVVPMIDPMILNAWMILNNFHVPK